MANRPHYRIVKNVDCDDDIWRTVIAEVITPIPYPSQVMESDLGHILMGWEHDDPYAPTPEFAQRLVDLLNAQENSNG